MKNFKNTKPFKKNKDADLNKTRMIEIRKNCENCNTSLPPNSEEAMICAFECTYCEDCVEKILYNVCPNCNGGFEKRPIMPKKYLTKYPPSGRIIFNPIDNVKFQRKLEKYKNTKPSAR